ncbi:hypothetical protein KC340_g7530 [Hortaea werneckii]|nr:hypothetical protein KC342_g14742 [Hortaea werneckii]KAI7103475.1 hypothetical protein KC339_g5244 [Hortaea werneckii]KAI7244307.1 hypothetical protein KC365_g1532 [Hortaea werneckii]KAI7320720.1 hypothetical protein KC340_g7530 [Hortaea werneckii]KAI7388480.1 hypothetical protein KC328_g8912 [Hortaea werneckii]
MHTTITSSSSSNNSGGGASSGKISTDVMTDDNLLNQLKLVRRNSKSRHSVCAFYKTLPPTPPPDIDCFVTIIFCSKLGREPNGGPFIPKNVVLEQSVPVSLPSECDDLSAMGVIEERALVILDEAKSKARGAQEICIGKLWRTEILMEREAGAGNGGVELSNTVWDNALMKLGNNGDKWEVIVAFHKPQVTKKKRQGLVESGLLCDT